MLRNTDPSPFFLHAGSGRLAGVNNASTLMHLRLPTVKHPVARHFRHTLPIAALESSPSSAAPAAPSNSSSAEPTATDATVAPASRVSRMPETGDGAHVPPEDPGLRQSASVDVVLELLHDGSDSYRVWNSEGWAQHSPPRGYGDLRRSPLAGPVGRGRLPAGSTASFQTVARSDDANTLSARSRAYKAWTPHPTEAYLVELDAREGTYRTIGVSVGDMDSLQPGSSRQTPLHFAVLADGSLDGDAAMCDTAPTREACASLGGTCGWCEVSDGGGKSSCIAGGPARPCTGTCAAWRFFDPAPAPSPSPPPPSPSPPGLSDASLHDFEAKSRELAKSTGLSEESPLPTATTVESGSWDVAHGGGEAHEGRFHAQQRLRRALRSLEQLALRPFEQGEEPRAY